MKLSLFGLLAGLALYLAFVAATSCSHVQATAEACAKQATPDLVQRVDAVLAGADYDAALASIEKEVALCVLRDAVAAVERANAEDTAALAAHDATSTIKIAHAQAWLAAHGGAPVATSTVKAGLPGGGNGFCCFHAGTGTRWLIGETSPGGVLLTSGNIGGLCATGALPIRTGCSAGH